MFVASPLMNLAQEPHSCRDHDLHILIKKALPCRSNIFS